MTKEQEKKLTPILKKLIKEVKQELKEESGKQLDSQELKVIVDYINGLSAVPHLDYSTNDVTIKTIANKIAELRIEMMNYVEDNSQYKFIGKSPKGWKLIKK